MYFNIPGLRNSPPDHWQSIWEKRFPTDFIRIEQDNWAEPDCATWMSRLEESLSGQDLSKAILIGHSVGCATIVNWLAAYQHRIKGALLVAPSDVEKANYPPYITGFKPLHLNQLPFPSIVVASTDDHVVSMERAQHFARCWGSELVRLDKAGHVEAKNGYGEWPEGLDLLRRLDRL